MTIDNVLADRRLGVGEYGVDGLPGSDHRAIHAPPDVAVDLLADIDS